MRNVFLHTEEYDEEPPAIPKRDETPVSEPPEEKPAEPAVEKKPKAKAWDKKFSIYLTNEEYELFRRYAFKNDVKISRAITDAAIAHIKALDET